MHYELKGLHSRSCYRVSHPITLNDDSTIMEIFLSGGVTLLAFHLINASGISAIKGDDDTHLLLGNGESEGAEGRSGEGDGVGYILRFIIDLGRKDILRAGESLAIEL